MEKTVTVRRILTGRRMTFIKLLGNEWKGTARSATSSEWAAGA